MCQKPVVCRGAMKVYEVDYGGQVISVYLGTKEDPESEHVLTIHKSYLTSLIAALSAAKDKNAKSY